MTDRELTEIYLSQNVPTYVYLCEMYKITPKTAMLALLKSRYFENMVNAVFRWGCHYKKFDFLMKLPPEREISDFDKEEIYKMFYVCYKLIVEHNMSIDEVFNYIDTNRIKIMDDFPRSIPVEQIVFDTLTRLGKDVSSYYKK